MLRFYSPGQQRPYYVRERWVRYERLRVAGFTRDEARRLSKVGSQRDPETKKVIPNIHGLKVLTTMFQRREQLLARFSTKADPKASPASLKAQWEAYVRAWMVKNKMTSVLLPTGARARSGKRGAKPDIFVLYNRTENALARRRGWKKQEEGEEGKGGPPRRPPKSGSGEGNWVTIKSAKQRAKQRSRARAKAIRDGEFGDMGPMYRQFVRQMREAARADPSRNAQLTRQARGLGWKGKSLI